jgi:1-acyl-sn-glycerol-3-phosphate acyltransferase
MLEKALYRLGRPVVGLYARLMLQLDVLQRAPLPDGPKILAANHPSSTDPFLITQLAPEQISIVIDGALFDAPVFGGYLRRAGHVPVMRENGRATVEHARRLLEAGRTVAIFPEGHVSPLDGSFYAPRTGTARLALRTGVPVIPVGIHIPRERIQIINLNFKGESGIAKWYLRGPYAMTVGEPMRFQGDVEDRPYVRSISEQIMRRIIQLSHQGARRMQPPPALATESV